MKMPEEKRKISVEWLTEMRACKEAISEFLEQEERDSIKLLKKMLKLKKYEWANWLITRVMSRKQCILYAVYAAELCKDNYNKEYPKENRINKAIKSARKVAENDTKENRSAAEYAGFAEYAAWSATYIKILEYGIKLLNHYRRK